LNLGGTQGDCAAAPRMRLAVPHLPLAAPRLPPALPQFEHIRRAWDTEQGAPVAKLLPGEYYVTRNDEIIFTVLGSCVSACVRERTLGIGGMNHFMLPLDRSGGTSAWGGDELSSATRYGNVAMERLINDILKLGGQRENLEFKVVGGGKVLDMTLDVGARNGEFVREYLKTEGFVIAGEDLGDRFARKLYYSPKTGKVRVKRLTSTVNRAVFEREQQHAPTRAQVESGSVELF
jgi:chemotaxis protein CheD